MDTANAVSTSIAMSARRGAAVCVLAIALAGCSGSARAPQRTKRAASQPAASTRRAPTTTQAASTRPLDDGQRLPSWLPRAVRDNPATLSEVSGLLILRVMPGALDQLELCVWQSICKDGLVFGREKEIVTACHYQGGRLDLTKPVHHRPAIE